MVRVNALFPSFSMKVLERCFHKPMSTNAWQEKIQEMIPSYRQSLTKDALLLGRVKNLTDRALGLSER